MQHQMLSGIITHVPTNFLPRNLTNHVFQKNNSYMLTASLQTWLRNIRGGLGSVELVADGDGGLFSFADLITNCNDSWWLCLLSFLSI